MTTRLIPMREAVAALQVAEALDAAIQRRWPQPGAPASWPTNLHRTYAERHAAA